MCSKAVTTLGRPTAGLLRPAAAAAALCSVMLTGCTGTAESRSEPEPEPPPMLALGERLDLEDLDYREEVSAPGAVTITGVRDGDISELVSAGVQLDEEQLATTPFYVDVTLANTSDVLVQPWKPEAETEDGDALQPLTIIDMGGPGFGPCPGIPLEVAPGKEVDGCIIFLATGDDSPARVSFLAPGTLERTYWGPTR